MNTIGVPFFNFQKKRRGEITPHPPPPTRSGAQQAGRGRGEGRGFPCFFFENRKCSFKSILEKKHHIFLCRDLLLYTVHGTFIEVPIFQETSPAPKNSCLRACPHPPPSPPPQQFTLMIKITLLSFFIFLSTFVICQIISLNIKISMK